MNLKLIDSVVASFKVAKVFCETKRKLNSFEFATNGEYVIASSEDEQIVLFDAERGVKMRAINSKKYGVDLVQFAKANDKALHVSTKVNDSIRHLNLLDNKYERYFTGHTARVVSLNVSPLNDTFMSAALDRTIRLWDLRSPNCQGLINVDGRVVAGFDPTGVVIAAGINSDSVRLYDVRTFDKGPFKAFQYPIEKQCEWTGLKFSYDGKIIMLNTNGTFIRLINAFYGIPMQTLTGYANNKHFPIEACFSPDSQYVFSGSSDGNIHVWNIDTGMKLCDLNAELFGPAQFVKFNPKLFMLVSGCVNLAFWLPTSEDGLVH